MTTTRAVTNLCVLAVAVAVCGCGGGEDVNARSLGMAKRLWQRAGILDYDLEWSSSGAREGHYKVRVRKGEVTDIQSIAADGSTKPAHPGDPSYYGVDGLFRTIEADMDHCLDLVKAGADKGAHVLLRFWPDAELGYPRRYRRDVTGAVRPLEIDVIRFDPAAAAGSTGTKPGLSSDKVGPNP